MYEGIRLVREDKYRWVLPKEDNMLVPGVVFASDAIIRDLQGTKALWQVRNVASLPGIIKASMAMPDIHEGYGFPIGGVAATCAENGVITPGGIGYDINCGVRLILSDLERKDVEPCMQELVDAFFRKIPSGVGKQGGIKLSQKEMEEVLVSGAAWATRKGYGLQADLEHAEESGQMKGADPSVVSDRAVRRGSNALGTLGSGNHFIEAGFVEEIYDSEAADAYGLRRDQAVFWVHSGSRGLGHQVCTDYIGVMRKAAEKYKTVLPDRQLDSAPLSSSEGRRYFGAMVAAANFAWANRQVLTHYVREAVSEVMGKTQEALGLTLLYDVAHNIGKIETHIIDGKKRKTLVHRKGATRAFGPGSCEIPAAYRKAGQPVLIPGDMGRGSYVLAGTARAMELAFGSACHGAGRVLSRTQAKKSLTVQEIKEDLASRGVLVRSATTKGLVEEAPTAYKDVDDVIEATAGAGLARKVARVRPLGVIKG